jgi:hypothetical protein
MALLPLNTFKTKTAVLSTTATTKIYTAPAGTTAIILMANAANISSSTSLVTMAHYRNLPILPDTNGNNGQTGNVTTEQVKNFAVPTKNAANLLSGKLILESLDSIVAYSNSTGTIKLTLSVLETANA